MKRYLLALLVIFSFGATAQSTTGLDLLGTRSWVRVSWQPVAGATQYRVYLSTGEQKPQSPSRVLTPEVTRAYFTGVQPETTYHIRVEALAAGKLRKAWTGTVKTRKDAVRDPYEQQEVERQPGSAAVPQGMQVVWQDEFNDEYLNLNKWVPEYFSTLNYLNETNRKEMLEGRLPEPGLKFNGNTLTIFVNDSVPKRIYMPGGNQKISSIQTYNWRTGENLLDNSRGGYFEVKVKRSRRGQPKGVNTAFWFDSPGPDLRYYLQEGTELNGTRGIRPAGQVFEIDVFEYITAQFVLHGHVNGKGEFQRNLNTHIAEGFQHEDTWVTHGIQWSPTAVKHFINGQLIKEYTDKHQIYSPNHFMNMFLGSYGSGGEVSMEVDYIRYYQWPLRDGNELPNPGFEDSGSLAPWEGDGTLSAGKTGSYGVSLLPGQGIEQYIYLDNDTPYSLEYWSKGAGELEVTVENVEMVSGKLTAIASRKEKGKKNFGRASLDFRSGKEYGDHKKTVRVSVTNRGTSEMNVDDFSIKKVKKPVK